VFEQIFIPEKLTSLLGENVLSRDEKAYLRAMAKGKLAEFKHPNPSVLRSRIRKKAKGLGREIKDFVEDVALLDAFMRSDGIHFSERAFLMPEEFRTSPRIVLAWRALGKVHQERKLLEARLKNLERMKPYREAIRKSIEAQRAMIDRISILPAWDLTRGLSDKISAYQRVLSNYLQTVEKKIIATESRWIRLQPVRLLVFECVGRNPGFTCEEITSWLKKLPYIKKLRYIKRKVTSILKMMTAKEILELRDGRYELSAFGNKIMERMRKDRRYLSRAKNFLAEHAGAGA
jgi:hypothetical protein